MERRITMRKRRLKRERRKRQILKVSMRLFSQKGFRGARTRNIARAAGISEAMVFKRFKNKRDLYNTVIRDRMEKHSHVFLRAEDYEKASDKTGFLMKALLSFVDSFEKDQAFIRMLFYGALEDRKFARVFSENYLPDRIKELEDLIRLVLKDGGYRDIDHRILVTFAIYMLAGHLVMQSVPGMKKLNPFDRDEFKNAAEDIILNGLKKR